MTEDTRILRCSALDGLFTRTSSMWDDTGMVWRVWIDTGGVLATCRLRGIMLGDDNPQSTF